MLRSSLGFHTLTLIMALSEKDARQLMQHFKRYSRDTGAIKIFPIDGKQLHLKYEQAGDGTQKTIVKKNKNYRIIYYEEDRGIEWIIRYNNWSADFNSYIVEVTINPKILGGVKDCVTAATYNDMDTAIEKFNIEAKRISPLLQHFRMYTLKRIDYCLNFFLAELDVACDSELVIELIRRADIPPHYEEFMEYCDKSHRLKNKSDSFYLINPSANINIYSKYMELKKRSEDRESKGLFPIPQIMIVSARNIIRFEIQCKYRKTYSLSNRAKENGNFYTNKYESLLTNDACNEAINYYFNKTIGKGDWHTLQGATRLIQSQCYNRQKEKRLIKALQLVNQCRGLAKPKASLQGRNLETFKLTLKALSELNINPVTIPKERGVKYIPNLLYTYYDKVQEEKNAALTEEWRLNNLMDCIKEFGYPTN